MKYHKGIYYLDTMLIYIKNISSDIKTFEVQLKNDICIVFIHYENIFLINLEGIGKRTYSISQKARTSA
jgi:hypothetical protein